MIKLDQSVGCDSTQSRVAARETARTKTLKATRGAARKLAVALAAAGCAALMHVPAAHASYFEASLSGDGSGGNAVVANDAAVAAGAGASASGGSSTAIGFSSRATDNGAAAFGASANAAAAWSLAVGTQAAASAAFGTALGAQAMASGLGASALGTFSKASGDFSLAVGDSAVALGQNSVALGTASLADQSVTALGRHGEDFGTTSTVAGSTAVGEVSVGATDYERRITHVAAAVDDTDATNLSQLKAVDGKVEALAKSGTMHYFSANGQDGGNDDALASGKQAVAIGSLATASADGSVALGQGSVADEAGTVSVGSAGQERRITNVADGTAATDAVNVGQLDKISKSGTMRYFAADGAADDSDDAVAAAGKLAVAAGANAQAQGEQAAAFGYGAQANGNASLAAGVRADAAAFGSVAVGAYASAGVAGAAAFGSYAVASGDRSTALGYLATAGGSNSVALGAGSLADRDNTVSVGSAGSERQITNVAAGEKDTDAVNVAQLKAIDAKADSTAAKLDGAVMYDTNADGSVNKNSVTLGGDAANGGTAIHHVADGVDAADAVNLGQLNAAITGAVSNIVVNTANPFVSAEGDRDTEGAVSSGTHSVAAGANAQAAGSQSVAFGANANASANNATALGAGAHAQADNAVALGQGSVADRANTVSVGSAGQERQIVNVAPGVQGTDAVNLNQLTQSMSGAVGQAVDQANHYTDDQIRSARRDAYGGTAAALAVAGLPQAVLPGRGMVAIAGGTYGGQSALAIGVSQLSETGKWVYKVQGTTDSRGQFGASLGAGMHW